VIAVLVREQDAIEFVRLNSALGEAENELARAQPAIDEQSAMIGRDERAVPSTPAPEHGEAKHCRLLTKRSQRHKRKAADKREQFSTAATVSDTFLL
jgi:hypothetical protein